MAESYRPIGDFVFRGRLMYPRGERGEVRPVLLPFGSVSRSLDGLRVCVTDGAEGVSVSFREKHGSKAIEVLPVYRTRRTLIAFRRECEVELWVLKADREKARAFQLILRSHYLSVPQRGFFLGCRFVHSKDEEWVRKKAERRKADPWSPAWQEPAGRMIGVAVADWLYHGIPNGRRQLAEKFHEDAILKKWDEMTRGELVHGLAVAWGARFAVDAPYRSVGVGTLLADELATVVAQHRIPRAKYIEVITTLPSDRADQLIESGSGDFLTRAGYFRADQTRPSSRQLSMNPETGDRDILVSARKLYYYRGCPSK